MLDAPDDAAELRAVKAVMEEGHWVTVSDIDGETLLAVSYSEVECKDRIHSAPTATELCAKLGVKHD